MMLLVRFRIGSTSLVVSRIYLLILKSRLIKYCYNYKNLYILPQSLYYPEKREILRLAGMNSETKRDVQKCYKSLNDGKM